MKFKPITTITFLLLICFMFFACANNSFIKPRKSRSSISNIKKTSPLYYDFRDVLIPNELKIVEKSIFGIGDDALGLMILKGRVESSSVVHFFSSNMTKDNWRLISLFKSARTYMLFQKEKEKRWCVISIVKGEYSFPSKIEIWVSFQDAPSLPNPADSGFSESLLH